MATFQDLPLDILILIFPYLEPVDFLNLCTTCSSLAQPSIRYESSYWSHQTQTKFRVPNRPAVQADGLRWQRLFKRLRTQSRVYTWGQNTHGCLGRVDEQAENGPVARRNFRRGLPGRVTRRTRNTWPGEMEMARDIGVISDIQCGGWSTSLLTSKGAIYTIGVLNGMNQWDSQTQLKALKFNDTDKELPRAHVAVKQFSSGRRHILGLSDDGTIFSWHNLHLPALAVTLHELDGTVQSVVAGWEKSSALVRGHGIILWDIISGGPLDSPRVIHDWIIIPKSSYRRPKGRERNVHSDDSDLGEAVGEVTSYTVLEHFVVFVTDLQRTFACQIQHNAETGIFHDIFELHDMSATAKDVQGSFRKFAVFRGDGEVLIADQDYLQAHAQQAFTPSNEPLPQVTRVPALQNSGVMQVAFGDYHYHALHSDGSVSSYGVEPDGSGAFGLGGAMDMDLPHGMLRGIKTNPWNRDGNLLPHAYTRGRRIWFQRENEAWLRFLANGGQNKEEAQGRMQQVGRMPPVQAEVSEWVEQMGSGWHKRPSVQKVDEDGLGAYFALSVAAAGWHSGALVLVNDKIVRAVRESCMTDIPAAALPVAPAQQAPEQTPVEGIANYLTSLATSFLGLRNNVEPHANNNNAAEEEQEDEEGQQVLPAKGKKWIWNEQDFPRLRLDHGVVMPGEVPFSEWKEPKPEWKLLWTGDDRKVFGVAGWVEQE